MKTTTFFLVAVLAVFQLVSCRFEKGLGLFAKTYALFAFVAGAALDTSTTASGNPYPLSLATISGTFLGEYLEVNGSADVSFRSLAKHIYDMSF